jgi:hypothetical protein
MEGTGVQSVRKSGRINKVFQAAEKLQLWGFVTGHDFSRADKANRINRALAPAQARWAKSLEAKPFSAACFSPGGTFRNPPYAAFLFFSRFFHFFYPLSVVSICE